MNHEEMSNFELNKKLADLLGIYWHSRPSSNDLHEWVYSDNYAQCDTRTNPAVDLADYCTDWNATMPLAVEHEITLDKIDGYGWGASQLYTDISFSCYDNPLRAIVICLIKAMENNQ